MGNHHRGPAANDGVDGALDLLLGDGVDRGCGLVQNQNPGITENGAGKAQKLLFTGGEKVPALPHVGVQALFQPVHKVLGRDQFQRPVNLLRGGFRVPVEQILPDGSGEELRRLENIADRGVQPELGALAGVPPVDQDAAMGGLIEAADQIGEGGLPCPGLSDDGKAGPEGNFQIKMLQHGLFPVGIAEADVLKLDVADERFPVFAPGMERVAVAVQHLRTVQHLRLRIEKRTEALNVDLGGDESADGVDDPAYRLHHPLGIGHEHREGADLGGGNVAALPQHQRKGHGRGKVHGAAEQAAQPGGPDALSAHVRGVGGEILLHAVFDHEAFDGAGAGDALVEVAGDAGVDLADLAVDLSKPALKQTEDQRGDRKNRDHRKRQASIGQQHHQDCADEIAALPDGVQQSPGTELTDAGGIAHDPGVDVADAVLIVVGEGQRLQMGKGGVAQIHVHADLNFHAIDAADIVEPRADQDDSQVEDQKERKGIQCTERDKVVQGVALKKRNPDVHHAAEAAGEQHQEKRPAISPELRKQTAETEEPVGILFHSAASSPMPDWMAQIL